MILSNFNPQGFGLPAANIIGKASEALSTFSTIIITAPPGAGKSTLLPLAFLQKMNNGGNILMLEPRRIAARQIALRMANMIGEEVGQTVGYRVRFEKKCSEHTRINVLTEGILTRMLLSDNELSNTSMVIFDEFHERNLHADLALALCRECQQILRPDLKIVIMSATIDTTTLTTQLQAPVIESTGRMFSVSTIHCPDCPPQQIPQQVAHYVREAHSKYQGDILAFLPGEAEIAKCEEMLSNAFSNTLICPLYGMLPADKQQIAIRPSLNGQRKVVLTTSIAETSLTIEGIRIVVDSGYCKTQIFDPNTGLPRLETVRISTDMADQRRGRAGRMAEGVCYRLWTTGTEAQMKPHRTPEIEHTDLSQLMLNLAAWGETKPENLVWLTPPPRHATEQAREALANLSAIDADGRITKHGEQINLLPCHPRIAQMLLNAKQLDEKALATDIAALLDARDPLPREAGTDINLRIEALRRHRRDKLRDRAFDRIEQTAQQYRRIIGATPCNDLPNCYATGKLIASAFPERIATRHNNTNATFRMANGSIAHAANTDTLAHEDWIAIATLDANNTNGRIFWASPIAPSALELYTHEYDNVQWDSRKGGIVAQHEMRIGKLLLSAKPLSNVDRTTIDHAIMQALKKEAASMLNFDDNFEQLQNRISSATAWQPQMEWPCVETQHLMQTASEWLLPYINKATTIAELKKIDLAEALTYALGYEQQKQLTIVAPTHIKVPSGSNIKLKYQPNGASPILAVRLQECFGMAETPTVGNGKQKITMHLLSPGYKPVQITQDLHSFWNDAYYNVKKELKGRYPKHVWPDNPWEEQAVRGAKKKS